MPSDFPYRSVFQEVESALLSLSARSLSAGAIQAALAPYRCCSSKHTDAEVFRKLTHIVFYSGFRASTVGAKLPVIDRHFPSFERVACYGESEIARILADPAMIRNQRKIRAVAANARALRDLAKEYGSFQMYMDSFRVCESSAHLLALKADLQRRFQFLGEVTAFHLLTDLGLPVLKPDRVLCRIFHRFGLLQNESDTQEAVCQGLRFAAATGHPIRYIDIIFVAFGQVSFPGLGIDPGICLLHPRCEACPKPSVCSYAQARRA
jgi:DNA-3-methyladenine glycosylase I